MALNKRHAGVAVATIVAGAILGYSLRSGEGDVSRARPEPSYDHSVADHVASISSQQQGRCYDVFPSDPELPPREAAHFPAWHKEHYGTDARDARLSSGINWRLLGQLNGEAIYVSFGNCNGHTIERVAYRGKTALVVDGVAPIESCIDAILKSMR